jgi:RNA polymerase sigma factor (sigma-70 family)
MDEHGFDRRNFRRLQAGDPAAKDFCYRELYNSFVHVGRRFLHDEHAANQAFNDSFCKLLGVKDDLEWQGTARFYAYFKSILVRTCIDEFRRTGRQRAWEDSHILPAMVEDSEGRLIQRVALLGGPSEIEKEAKRHEVCQASERALADFEQSLTSRERQILAAYRKLQDIPGSDSWSPHQKTAFLQEQTGMNRNSFYVTHSRLRRKAIPYGKSLSIFA